MQFLLTLTSFLAVAYAQPTIQRRATCGVVGYDKNLPNAYHFAANTNLAACAALCASESGCSSLATGSNGDCLLYTSLVANNFVANPGSSYVFNDLSCIAATGSPSALTSGTKAQTYGTLTVTVTGSANTATVTVSASPVTVTASANPVTVTASASPVTVTASASPVTVTTSASPVTVTAPASSVTVTAPANTVSVSVTVTKSATITQSATITVTNAVTSTVTVVSTSTKCTNLMGIGC